MKLTTHGKSPIKMKAFSLNSLLDEINFYLVKFDFLTVILIGKNDLRLDGVNAI